MYRLSLALESPSDGEARSRLSDGLVGREESYATSLKTRSCTDPRCDIESGDPGTEDGARVVAFDHRFMLEGTVTAV